MNVTTNIEAYLTLYYVVRTIAILKSIDSDPEMIQFIHSRRYIGMLVQTWKDGLNKSRLHIRDYIDITLDLDLIIHLLKVRKRTWQHKEKRAILTIFIMHNAHYIRHPWIQG